MAPKQPVDRMDINERPHGKDKLNIQQPSKTPFSHQYEIKKAAEQKETVQDIQFQKNGEFISPVEKVKNMGKVMGGILKQPITISKDDNVH